MAEYPNLDLTGELFEAAAHPQRELFEAAARRTAEVRSDLRGHLDVAADRAMELAEALTRDRVNALDSRVAQHLQYMAGLIRGSASETDQL